MSDGEVGLVLEVEVRELANGEEEDGESEDDGIEGRSWGRMKCALGRKGAGLT
jgi:hypothetical protein